MGDEWDVIYSYSRKQAIEDGILVEVDRELSQEAGIGVHVALTSTLYNKYIKSDLPGQDETGRLWDVLGLFRMKAPGCDSNTLFFEVYFQMEEDKKELLRLKAIIGPGDSFKELVITIMLPEED